MWGFADYIRFYKLETDSFIPPNQSEAVGATIGRPIKINSLSYIT